MNKKHVENNNFIYLNKKIDSILDRLEQMNNKLDQINIVSPSKDPIHGRIQTWLNNT